MFSVGEPTGSILQRYLLKSSNTALVADCGVHCLVNECSGFMVIRSECILFGSN